MKRIENYEEIQASGNFKRLIAGGYVCRIMDVEDVPMNENTGKGDYLKINYDIAVNDLKNYFLDFFEKFGYWSKSGTFMRSYKESALGMFKHFTNCVEESNLGYKWDFDETTLKGKLVGLVLGEEEYIANDGETKTRIYVKDIKTVEQIMNNDFVVPPLKKLKFEENQFESDLMNEAKDLPF